MFKFVYSCIVQNADSWQLIAASLHIDYPMLFELRNNATDRVSHCGVLEFIAEEGMIYMPYWVSLSISCSIYYFRLIINVFYFTIWSILPIGFPLSRWWRTCFYKKEILYVWEMLHFLREDMLNCNHILKTFWIFLIQKQCEYIKLCSIDV